MSKTIVFGASGFVGKALLPLLEAQGVKCMALSSAQLDLTSEAAIPAIAKLAQDGDRIIFLPALTPEKGPAPALTVKNIAMMHHVLAGIAERNIAHFIYVSSDAVYPLTADVIDERTRVDAPSLYGRMHALREQFAQDHFPPEKLTILRPCAIYGEGDSHNAYGICRFLRSAREKGEIALFGEGEEYRDHVHVDDVAAIIAGAHARALPGIFNIASGTSWRFGNIAAYIKTQLGGNITITYKPRAMPVSHRHVNITQLCTAFPAQLPRKIDVGLQALLQMRDAA